MRAVALNSCAADLAVWERTVAPSVAALMRGPGIAGDASSSGSGSSEGGGLRASLVLTARDTWAACAGCNAYFDRLTVKHTCALCQRAFCARCGLAATPVATAVLVRALGLEALRRALVRAGTAVPARLAPRVCARCARFCRHLEAAARASAAPPAPPAWVPRYEECLRIADGCAQTLALVTGGSGDNSGSGDGNGSSSNSSNAASSDIQAAVRMCESVAAMVRELEEACAWLGSIAAPTRTEAALLRNVRRRLVNTVSSTKAQLVAARAQLALRPGKGAAPRQ